MSNTWGPIIIKVNLGVEDQLRDKDTTTDDDGKNKHSRSDTTDAPAMSSPKPMRGNMK